MKTAANVRDPTLKNNYSRNSAFIRLECLAKKMQEKKKANASLKWDFHTHKSITPKECSVSMDIELCKAEVIHQFSI